VDDRPTVIEAIDIIALLKHLPHRYPFLMVDRIRDIDGDQSAVGIKNVTFNEPHFMGHFPGSPIMPGVLLVEGIAQTAGAISIATLNTDRRSLVYFMSIDKAKFRKPVIPGDTVEFHVTKLRQRKNIVKYYGEAMVDGEKVAEAVISAMLRDETAPA
jgi:3-hydroxyacyl-[acyl-carrier-protein] dehydratase